MELDDALAFTRATTKSILVTIRANTRPQLSNVLHTVDDAGLVRVSITATRAKYHNLRRDPWAALHVMHESFWSYVVVEGSVELSPVVATRDDETLAELVEVYRAISGKEPGPDFGDRMVEEQRVVARFRPERAYGLLNHR